MSPTPTEILTTLPTSIVAGTTVKYTRSDVNYPASQGWSNVLHLVGAQVIPPISGTAVGDSFQFVITPTMTATVKPGRYQWREFPTKGADIFLAAGGVVEILPNIAASGAGEMRTWEERCLELVELRLEGRFTADMERYSVGGRSVEKMNMVELMRARNWLKTQVRQQASPGRFGDEVKVVFPGMAGE